MLNAIHALMYVKDAQAARAFFQETLGWPHVDAGEGWLIFALPPAEMGVHPIDEPDDNGTCELYLMCDDIEKTVAELAEKGVKTLRPITDQGYGLFTAIMVPGGGELGIYEPRHPLAARLGKPAAKAKRPAPRPARRGRPAKKAGAARAKKRSR